MRRTASHLVQSILSLRFEWLNRAGRIVRPRGRATLRLAPNPRVEARFLEAEKHLKPAA
jgi:hypothetical protein